jgi:4-amino-4-deoxy-L-arabinose transferase-like glycosyltransferase
VARFNAWLAGLAVLGFGLSLLYALAVSPGEILAGDAGQYHALAQGIANGDGYSTLASIVRGDPLPTAQHPPLFPLLLAGLDVLGVTSMTGHRVVLCLAAAASVVLIGLLGRRAAGPRAGIVAAAVGAFYPSFVVLPGVAMAEVIYVPLVAGALLVGYAAIDRPAISTAALAGALAGLATLVRPEALLLLVLLAFVLVLRMPARRLAGPAAALLAGLAVLTPWLARNWVQFDTFPLLSTNGGLTAMVANCRAAYYERIGFFEPDCSLACIHFRENELRHSRCGRRVARRYAEDHLERVPLVIAARVARTWNLAGIGTDVSYAEFGGRNRTMAKLGVALYWLLLPLAGVGLVALVTTRQTVLPLLIPIAMVILATAVTFGNSKYRVAADVAVGVLAAAGCDRLLSWRRARRQGQEGRGDTAAPRPDPTAPLPGSRTAAHGRG